VPTTHAMRTLGAKCEKEHCVGELRKYVFECIKEGVWNNECEWAPPHEYCRLLTIKNPPFGNVYLHAIGMLGFFGQNALDPR